MKLPEFAILTNNELDHTFILQTKQPYYYGRVIFFETPMDYTMWTNSFRGLAFAQVPNYKIVIAFESSLSGKAFVIRTFIKDLQIVMDRMAEFYYTNNVKVNKKFFSHYVY